MDFAFSEIHREIQSAARRFAEAELGPRGERLEETPDPELEAKLDDLEFWGLGLPESVGGVGLDPLAVALVVEAFGRSSPSLAWRFGLHAGPASAAVTQSGLAQPDFATSAGRLGCALGARGVSGSGSVVVIVEGEHASVVRAPTWTAESTLGLRGAQIGRVEGGEVLASGIEGIGPYANLVAAALLVGTARGALHAALRYAQERRQFGSAIADFQAIQWKLADGAVAVDAAAWMTWAACFEGHVDFARAARARLFAGKAALATCSGALQVHGGYGYTREYPVERLLRAARMLAAEDQVRGELGARISP